MKRNLLFITLLVMFSLSASSQDNTSLQITTDGTWFSVAGLAETLITDCTMEGWVKVDPAVAVDDYTALIDFRDAAAGNSKALIFKNLSGNLTTSYEWHGSWGYQGTANVVVPGVWQHVAMVISSTPKETRFYVNGVQTGSDNTYPEAGVQHPLGENVRVGGGNSMAVRTLIGTMDEIRVWTVARTEAEIFENMAKEIDPATTGLLAYYRCNEAPASTQLTDATGHGLNLTAVGTNYTFAPDADWAAAPSSISDKKDLVSISAFPNPVKDELNFKGIELKNADIRIFDVTGRLIEKRIIDASFVNVAFLETGLYIIEIRQGKDLYKGKFIKE